MIVLVITFSILGYLMINTLFTSSLEREIVSAKDESDLLKLSFETSIANSLYDNKLSKKELHSLINSVEISSYSDVFLLKVRDDRDHIVLDNIDIETDFDFLHSVSVGKRGHKIINTEDKYYVYVVYPIEIANQKIYIESFRDVTAIFIEREEQHYTFRTILVLTIVANGILLFIVSLWLTFPIKRLSKAAKLMKSGDLSERVKITSKDEIGQLSEDFNAMAQELQLRMEEIQDNSKRQEEFVGSFAHELKTPLTSIIGYSDMLRSKQMTEEQRILAADYIYQEGKRLESLSFKLLELIVLKKRDFKMKSVSVKEILKSVYGVMLPILKKQNIGFYVSAQKSILMIEPDLIKTVLINLIDNSTKAMESNGNIKITGEVIKNHYVIKVIDDGKGIEKDEIEKISDAFYMVNKSRSRARGGAGLGLSICKEIIELHDASMEIQSVIGEGTCIKIIFKMEV